jgi:starch synthase
MIVLMVAAEFSPYTEWSSTATTVAALSRSLAQLGHDVNVVAPKSSAFEEKGLLIARRLSPLELPHGGSATLFDGQLASGVKLTLIDSPSYFDRVGVYGEDGSDYADNAERFGFFARAVAALISQRREQGQPFDLVHAFDWPGALAVLHLKSLGLGVPCVLGVHDVCRTGSFDRASSAALAIPSEYDNLGGVQAGEGINVIKGGVLVGNAITTPSPQIALDLRDESRSGALALAFARRADVTMGILGGVDYAVYNPATDSELAARFDAEQTASKGTCRTALVRELGLELDVDRPLAVVFVGSSAEAALLVPAVGQLLRNDLALIVALRQPLSERTALEQQATRDSCAVLEIGSDALERKLYAAADIAISLDSYSIDAFGIRKAQRYGAVPIARASGAALDAIVDADSALETGTGFLFKGDTELVPCVQRALAAYHGAPWAKLRRRIMRLDLSWDRAAHRYLAVYRQLT